jgi:hypothetical protein
MMGFASAQPILRRTGSGTGNAKTRGSKSFLLLFFKKEALASPFNN